MWCGARQVGGMGIDLVSGAPNRRIIGLPAGRTTHAGAGAGAGAGAHEKVIKERTARQPAVPVGRASAGVQCMTARVPIATNSVGTLYTTELLGSYFPAIFSWESGQPDLKSKARFSTGYSKNSSSDCHCSIRKWMDKIACSLPLCGVEDIILFLQC